MKRNSHPWMVQGSGSKVEGWAGVCFTGGLGFRSSKWVWGSEVRTLGSGFRVMHTKPQGRCRVTENFDRAVFASAEYEKKRKMSNPLVPRRKAWLKTDAPAGAGRRRIPRDSSLPGEGADRASARPAPPPQRASAPAAGSLKKKCSAEMWSNSEEGSYRWLYHSTPGSRVTKKVLWGYSPMWDGTAGSLEIRVPPFVTIEPKVE